MRPQRLAGILLAAGEARRFGGNKMLALLPDGSPLSIAALRSLRAAVDQIIAVVQPGAAVAPLLAAEGAHLAICSGPEIGIGNSIATGVQALEQPASSPRFTPRPLPACSACLIALADMPFVRAATMQQLAAALRAGESIVAPEYRGTRGHPVGFAHRWFAQLRRMRGDHGARHLLAVHRDAVRHVPVDDPGVLADVDRPADLATYTAAWR